MKFEFHDLIYIIFTIISAAMTFLINRFFQMVDEERKYFKEKFDKIDDEIMEMKDDISDIKVMIGKLQVKNKL